MIQRTFQHAQIHIMIVTYGFKKYDGMINSFNDWLFGRWPTSGRWQMMAWHLMMMRNDGKVTYAYELKSRYRGQCNCAKIKKKCWELGITISCLLYFLDSRSWKWFIDLRQNLQFKDIIIIYSPSTLFFSPYQVICAKIVQSEIYVLILCAFF